MIITVEAKLNSLLCIKVTLSEIALDVSLPIVTNCPVFLIRFANQYTIYISSISPFFMYIYIYPYIELIISDVRQYTLDLAAQFLVESHNMQIYNYILHAHVYTPKACYH